MTQKLPKSKIPAVDGYKEPKVVPENKLATFFEVGGERFHKESTAKSASKRLGKTAADVSKATANVDVFLVEDELFFTQEAAEKRLKSLLKKHRDRVREVARMFGVDKASAAAKLEPLNWLMEHYSLEDIEGLEFDSAFFKGSKRSSGYTGFLHGIADSISQANPEVNMFNYGRPSQNRRYSWGWMKNRKLDRSDVPAELKPGSPERSAWVDAEQDFGDKLWKLNDLMRYRTAEVIYRLASEHADVDDDGDVVNVLPLQMIVDLIDTDLVVDEIKDIYVELNRVENGASLEVKTLRGRVQYWLVDDKKNLDPFKKF